MFDTFWGMHSKCAVRLNSRCGFGRIRRFGSGPPFRHPVEDLHLEGDRFHTSLDQPEVAGEHNQPENKEAPCEGNAADRKLDRKRRKEAEHTDRGQGPELPR
jgi:hypothetical protein